MELIKKLNKINIILPIKIGNNTANKLLVKANNSILFEELYFSDILESVYNSALKAKSLPKINFKRDNLIGSCSNGEF